MPHFPSPAIEEGIEEYPAMPAALGVPGKVVTMKPTRERVLRGDARPWRSPAAVCAHPQALVHVAQEQEVGIRDHRGAPDVEARLDERRPDPLTSQDRNVG
jgi:hypothetical protein